MTQQRKPQIVRRETFIVDNTEVNEYGDLIVTSKDGSNYKVAMKRQHLWDVFQPGAEVRIGYAEFKGRQYIAEANNGTSPQPQAPQSKSSTVISQNRPVSPTAERATRNEVAPPAIGMTTKEIGDLIRSKMLSEVFRDNAHLLLNWYKNQIYHNTGVNPVVEEAKKLGATEVEP